MDLLQNLVFLREKGEEPHLHCGQTKYNQQNGSIYLTNKRVLWVPSGSTTPTLNVPLSIVLGHFVSPATHKKALLKISINLKGNKEDHVFEFASQHAVQERDGFKQFLARMLPKQQKTEGGSDGTPGTPSTPATPGTPATPAAAASGFKPPPPRTAEPSIQEAKQRAALLASNPELSLCYEQLVSSGIITPSEFWASRQHLIDAETSKQSAQQKGTPTALITEVRPSQETLGGEIKYRLTPEIIRQIFLEYPGVKQVYDENVPHKLSERDFWKKYFQSQYFHRDRLTGTTINVAERDIFDRCAEEDERVYAPPVKRPRGIDPTVDVSGEDVLPDGYGDAETLRRPKAKSLSLIRRYNRHGALVIGSHPSGQNEETEAQAPEKAKDRLSEAVRLPDLETTMQTDVAPLRIKDPRLYFEGHSAAPSGTAAARVDTNPAELLNAFHQSLKAARKAPATDAKQADEVMKELQRYIVRGKFNDVVNVSNVDLAAEVQSKMMEQFLTVNELLRHFWSTHKQAVISPESFTKLTRVSKTLQTRRAEMEDFLKAQPGDRARNVLRPLVDSMDHALKAATRYLQAA